MKKYTEIKGKVVNRSFDPEFDNKFYKALEGLEKTAANREKEILENVNEIYIESGQDYLVANVYDKEGKGFEFVIEHEYRKPGHISG